MKNIYLDMNIFAEYIHKDRTLHNFTVQFVDNLKNNGNMFLYSPAHIEETALILSQKDNPEDAKKYIEQILLNLSNITDNNECLPSEEGILIKQEHPKLCYKRVLDSYNLTILAEINEKIGVDSKHINIDNLLKEYDTNRSFIGNIGSEIFFHQEIIQKIFSDFLKYYSLEIKKWKEIQNIHKEIEGNISILFDFIETIGYKTDGTKKYRSMMHDVTHAIYGTQADCFITNDKNFKLRLEAIYSYLQVPTKIFLLKELKLSNINLDTIC